MGNQRKAYTPEYKDEAVKLVINTGRPVGYFFIAGMWFSTFQVIKNLH